MQSRLARLTGDQRKWALAGIILALLLVAAFLAWPAGQGGDAGEVATVERGDITATVNALGTIQPQTAVEVGAQVSGQITRLLVAPGDVVTKGQLLAEIDPSIPLATVEAGRAQLAGLRAQLAEQQAQLVLARRQYARQQQMDREGSTRTEDVQTAEANMQVAAARVDNLRAQIQQTASQLRGDEAQLGFTNIYAPIAGTVVSVDAKEGQTLNATYQTPTILRIADLSRMTVWTEVSEADVRSVKPGMTARFTTLGDDEHSWSGAVRQILPAPPTPPGETATQGSGGQRGGTVVLYTVLFDVDNADGALMPQMTAQVVFVTASAKGVLVAPLAALEEVEGKPGRYRARVIDGRGRVETREVQGGARDRMAVEVRSGLKAGDRLVVSDGSQT